MLVAATGIAVAFASAAYADTSVQSKICTTFAGPTLTAPADNTQTQESSIHVVGTGEPGMAVTILEGSTGIGVAVATSDGSYALEIPLHTGSNSLKSRETNSCGTIKESSPVQVIRSLVAQPPGPPSPILQSPPIVDTLAPTAPAPASASSTDNTEASLIDEIQPTIDLGGGLSSGTTQTLQTTTSNSRYWVKGTARANSTVNVYVNGVIVATVIASEDGTYAALVQLKNGDNQVKVQSTYNGKTATSLTVTITFTEATTTPHTVLPKQGWGIRNFSLAAIATGGALLMAFGTLRVRLLRQGIKKR